MCQFFSALAKYLGDGEVELIYDEPGKLGRTDSHYTLAANAGINNSDKCAKIEYQPIIGVGWQFVLDEVREPNWWTNDIQMRVIDRLDEIIKDVYIAPKAGTIDAPEAGTIYASGCTALTQIDAPEARYIDASGCTALTQIDAPKAGIIR